MAELVVRYIRCGSSEVINSTFPVPHGCTKSDKRMNSNDDKIVFTAYCVSICVKEHKRPSVAITILNVQYQTGICFTLLWYSRHPVRLRRELRVICDRLQGAIV